MKETELPIDSSDTLSSTDYVRAVVNILEDIGDEKQRLETTQKAVLNILEDLEDEKRSAQEANRMKSEFLANMSHELRTPLNSIIGFSELMSDGKVGPIAENHKEYLGDILTSARHLLQLINDVLDLAKVEAGKIEFEAENIEIHPLIHGIRDTLRSIAAARKIQVDVEIDDDFINVIGDAARLKQVLYNYLSNALKFTPEGGHVVITATKGIDNFYKISVQDNGDGIAPEHLSRLFVEFEQLDASIGKRHQGTGLGLALTKRLVEAQGGSVGVESAVGYGSTFYAILPVTNTSSSVETRRLPYSEDSFKSDLPKVLVIEDEAIERNNIIEVLSLAGFDPYGAATGEEAINLAQLRKWDAITLDLMLPDTTGTQVLAEIRANDLNVTTPVIVVTALPDKLITAYSIQELLTKPTQPEQLIAAIKRTEKVGFKKRHILIIEDEPNDLTLVEKHLQNAGYKTTGLSKCEDAIDHLAVNAPDAIILDLMMPGMDGFEMLNFIKNHDNYSQIPVIIWSENADSDRRNHTDFSNASAYLLKSAGHGILLRELERSIQHQLNLAKKN